MIQKKKKLIEKNDINFKYPVLAHGNSNPNSNTYGLFLMRCQNNSDEEVTNCYNINDSDDFALRTFSFAIYFIDQYVDVTNYHSPLSRFFNKIRNQIILESYTINNLNYKPISIATHSGIIFNEKTDIYSFALDVNEKFINDKANTGIYGVFYFWMGNQAGVYDRTYQKIQDVSASISGISKIIMGIGYFINYFIHEFTLISDLRFDVLKKTGKFGKKSSTKGITSQNLTGILNPPSTPLTSNKLKNQSVQYNNFMNDTNVSKINLMENNLWKKSIKIKNITFLDVFCYKCYCKQNNYFEQLLNVRKKVLSEEKLTTEYYINGMLSDLILKRNKFNSSMLKGFEELNPKKYESFNRKTKCYLPLNRKRSSLK